MSQNILYLQCQERPRNDEKGGRREKKTRGGGREETEAREGGKFHTVCLLFFTLRENSMTQSDGRATVLESLNSDTGDDKNPLGVVYVCSLYLRAKKELCLRREDRR